MIGTTQIRPGRSADAEVLIALSRRTIAASYRSFLGDAAVDGYINGGAVDEYVSQNVDRSWVIMLDGQIVGYSVAKDDTIDLMMIDHPFHRRGLGTELLQHAEGILFQNYEQLTLESFTDNMPANRFYRKHGWNEIDRYHDDESGVDKIVFRKTIPTAVSE